MRRLLPALLAVAAIYAVCIALASSARPAVGVAIGFDLTVTAAAVFWLLAVRPGHARPRALWRLVAVGFVAAKLLVGLGALGAAGIAVEIGVLALLVVRLRWIIRGTRTRRRDGDSLTHALDGALAEVVPAVVASVLAVEISAVVLAITGWFRRAPAGFSMHRATGYLAILGTLCALVVVETVVAHVALAPHAPVLAIAMTALSAYGLVWLVGDAHAVRLSPLRITPAGLVIERGVRSRVLVPVDRIAAATPISARVAGAIDLSYLGPNVLLSLHEPVAVHGLFGRTRTTAQLTLSVDDRDALFSALREAA